MARVSIFFLLLFLHGCVGKNETEPKLHEIGIFSQSGSDETNGSFWRVYEDDELNELIERALKQNLNLKAVNERIKQAEYLVTTRFADRLPSTDINYKGSNKHTLHGKGMEGDTHSVGRGIDYEVDLWGRISALSSEAGLKKLIADESYIEAQNSLIAEVAKAWFLIASLDAKERLINEQMGTAKKVLASVEIRFESGKADASDILRQQKEITALEGELLSAKMDRESQIKKLQILAGESPTKSFDKKPMLSTKEPFPKSGLPSELLQNRPDLRSSLYLLKSKDAKAVDAHYKQYPRIILSLDIESSAASLPNLFENWISTFLGSITQPLFKASALEATAKSADSEAIEAGYLYADAYLKAVYEVEDAISSLKYRKKIYLNLENQTKLSEGSFMRLLERYNNGATTLLDTLSALTTWQRLQRDLINARYQLLAAQITLYKSLGMKKYE